MGRFSVVCFVWGPGQKPRFMITRWGMVGAMRGCEVCEDFDLDPITGHLQSLGTLEVGTGSIDFISARVGDIHRVSNALADRSSISIHVYGANIGAIKRNVYEVGSVDKKTFVSGYSIPD